MVNDPQNKLDQNPKDKIETLTQSEPKRSKVILIIAIIIVLLALLLAGGYWYLYVYNHANNNTASQAKSTASQTKISSLPKDNQTSRTNTQKYNNDVLGMTFNYPSNWDEYDVDWGVKLYPKNVSDPKLVISYYSSIRSLVDNSNCSTSSSCIFSPLTQNKAIPASTSDFNQLIASQNLNNKQTIKTPGASQAVSGEETLNGTNYYIVFVYRDDGIHLLQFPLASSRTELDEEQKQVLDSFKLTDSITQRFTNPDTVVNNFLTTYQSINSDQYKKDKGVYNMLRYRVLYAYSVPAEFNPKGNYGSIYSIQATLAGYATGGPVLMGSASAGALLINYKIVSHTVENGSPVYTVAMTRFNGSQGNTKQNKLTAIIRLTKTPDGRYLIDKFYNQADTKYSPVSNLDAWSAFEG